MEVIDQTTITKRILTKSIAQRVASNFGWSVVSEGIGKGVSFITNIYLARTLGVENFGLFTLAQTITFYLWLAVDLGTSMYGIREIAKNKEHAEDIINPLFTLRITAGLVVFSIYVSSLFFFNMPMTNKLTFAGCGLYFLTYAFYSDWVFKGLEKFKYMAFGSFIFSMVFLMGTIYLVKGSSDVISASFVWSISYFFGSTSLLYFLYRKLSIKYKPCFNFKIFFLHLRESIYFMISGSLMLIYHYLPILFLSVFFTNHEVGLFAAPFRVVLTIGSAGFLLPSAFYPVLAEIYLNNTENFKITHKSLQIVMVTLGVSIAIVGAILGENIIIKLFGSEYVSSTRVFKIIIWLIPLYFIRYSFGSVILATGFQRWHNLATFTGVVFMVISSSLLIPKFNLIGASLSLLIAETALVLSMSMISRSKVYGEFE